MAKNNADRPRRHGLFLQRRTDVLSDLDPRLQELILRHKKDDLDFGEDPPVDVICRLKNPDEEIPEGLEVVRRIGDVVTGTVAVSEIERVRTHGNVVSLKAATPVSPQLDASVREIRGDAPSLRQGLGRELDGSGVIVGIVDYHCDFRHGNFRDPKTNETRILYLWDQRKAAKGAAPKGFGYGRELKRAEINQALKANDPYQALGYRPRDRAHGTHVMDIAAGNGAETNVPGLAPGADLIFVHLATDDVGDQDSLGNSRRLLEAVDYIFEKADKEGKRPVVVNLSLGTHAGPHDGTTLVERGFDRLLQEKPGRAIVIAAGNSRNGSGHSRGKVGRDAPKTLTWQIAQIDLTSNELEIWYEDGASLDVTLIDPDGQEVGTVAPGETCDIMEKGSDESQGWIIHRTGDPGNGDNQINILLSPSLARGTWRIRLSTSGTKDVPFHAWIERDDSGPSRFVPADTDPAYTLGSICCGKHTIAVGAYDPRDQGAIASFSSEGPTRKEGQKPEISAPGDGINAAASGGDSRTASGTSMAAPHVTGLIALLFQAESPARLTIEQTRKRLIDAARPIGTKGVWDARYGFGRVDALATLKASVPASLPALQPELGEILSGELVAPANGNGNGNGHHDTAKVLAALLSGKKVGVRIWLELEPPQ